MQHLTIPSNLSSARILISNDDGIYAQGLHLLAEVMRSWSDDVWVVAPETEQSGAGHSLTLHRPLRARAIDERTFAVSGTPTDCVLVGVQELLDKQRPVDIVVSGINHGDNMAQHVTYSGTIAAAMEGTLLGIPSIAFSQSILHNMPLDWDNTRAAVHEVMRSLQGFSWEPFTLLSVNIPDCAAHERQPLCVAEQGIRMGNDEGIDARIDPRGRSYYWIGGADYRECVHEPHTDCARLQAHHTVVTPIALNLTNHRVMSQLATHLHKM